MLCGVRKVSLRLLSPTVETETGASAGGAADLQMLLSEDMDREPVDSKTRQDNEGGLLHRSRELCFSSLSLGGFRMLLVRNY